MTNKEYEAKIEQVRNIFELFGVDKEIINEKLDNGEVSQTDFDQALSEL